MFENLKKFSPEGCNGSGDPTPETCTHDCGSCPSGGSCGSFDPASLIEKANKYSNVGKVIAVVSGKGGVGKTLVTSMMATTMKQRSHTIPPMCSAYVLNIVRQEHAARGAQAPQLTKKGKQ